MSDAQPRLAVAHASKTYGAVTVLDDAHLAVKPGEIHSLIGQNGSGKSTMVKILTGYHAPDPGTELTVDGRTIELPVRWSAAKAAGLSVVHQDLGLLDHLTVSENIGIGGFVHSRLSRRINWRRQDDVATTTLASLDLEIDPRTLVGSLPAARRAEVAIARALRDLVPGHGLIVLDEATRSLPKEDLEHFHNLLRRIAVTGTSILMVTHSLDEVLDVSDCVTVLRDGRVVASAVATSGLSSADLARMMLGKTIDAVVREMGSSVRDEEAAALRQVRLPLDQVLDLNVHAGEIVGVTGLPGTGFEELPHVLGGGRRAQGHARMGRRSLDLSRTSVRRSIGAGVAMVPERRLDEGLAVDHSIRDNLALPSLRRRGRPWFVARGWQRRQAHDAIRDFGIKAPHGDSLIKELSGGNQQKVLLAKWLSMAPRLLVLHEPTQAVDVGARADILRALDAVAASGAGVLLISTEPTDLAEICDRVLVLRPGSAPIELQTRDPEDILSAVYTDPPVLENPHA